MPLHGIIVRVSRQVQMPHFPEGHILGNGKCDDT